MTESEVKEFECSCGASFDTVGEWMEHRKEATKKEIGHNRTF